MIESFGASDIGCVRKSNQDRVLIDPDLGLFAVADGMGGRSHGELAAEVAISTIHHYINSSRDRFDISWPFGYDFNLSLDSNRLVTGIQLANRQVWKHAEQGPEYAGMGTTIAAVLFADGLMNAANVGDSRIYLLRDGELRQLSIDDTWINAMTQRGGLPAGDLIHHPMKNFLTQAAGSQEKVDVHSVELDAQPGDLVLITSDGLHGIVPEEAILTALHSGDDDLERLGSRLIGAARNEGGPDNISCVLVRYQPS